MTAELLERLGLDEVTLVQNDHGAALALAGDNPRCVARLVVSSCEAFENYPPGLPGKNLRLAAMVPGGLFAAMQAMRLPAVRRSPLGFGWMAKRPLPDALVTHWLRPLQTDPGVRYDLARYARNARRSQMVEVCDRLRSFARCSSSGHPRTACSAQTTAGSWRLSCQTRGSSKSPTATR
jgi:hypothetical protein